MKSNDNISLKFLSTLAVALLLPSMLYAEQSTNQAQLDKDKTAKKNNTEYIEHIEVFGREVVHANKKYDLNKSFNESFSRERIFSKQLQQDSATDLKSALRGISNVRVTEQGSFSKKVSIRGLSGERTVYLIDGVKLPNQGLTHSGGAEGNLVDVNQIEYIEVIKGSPAVIYDPGASGGIVNVHTKNYAEKEFFKLGFRAGYDQGYDKKSHSVNVSGVKNGFFAGLSASDNDTGDYLVKHQDKINELIKRSNDLQERTGTEDAFTDLGYQDQSQNAQLGYSNKNYGQLSLKYNDYQAQDISFTHGAVNSQIFHYDNLLRQAVQLTYQTSIKQPVPSTVLALTRSKIEKQQIDNITQVDTLALNIKSAYDTNYGDYDFGLESIADEAETNVNATMDYYAAYLSGQWYWQQWQFNAGMRYNLWQVEKQFSAGENLTIRCQLAGASGCLKPIDDSAITWSMASIFSLDESNNISVNFSKTHRQPSLYERVAFDTFWGCHNDCQAEQADNAELSWKYFDQDFFISASAFYSDFTSYLTTKEIRTIKPNANFALIECINFGFCNPLEGEYNDREGEFFSTGIKYFSLDNVVNQGAELIVHWFVDERWQVQLNASYNQLSTDSDWVDADSRPLELNTSIRHQWALANTSPWVKLNIRYVTDQPKVKQQEGFSAFVVTNIYFGIEFDKLNINAGIRNLFDAVYHQPYGALDGLKRSAFVSLNVEF